MALSTTLDKGLAQYFCIVWDVLGQSHLFSAAVTMGLVLTGVHILLMLESCVHVGWMCIDVH